MAISDSNKALLDSMCKTAKTAGLGTVIQTIQNQAGTHTVTAGEETAGSVDIDSGLTSVAGFIVQVYRAGILLASYDVSASAGVVTVATNGTDYVVTEADVINYFIY